MTPRYVPDLMSQHTCQLAHVARPFGESTIHADPTPRQRKRVDLLTVGDRKVPGEVARVGDLRELEPSVLMYLTTTASLTSGKAALTCVAALAPRSTSCC